MKKVYLIIAIVCFALYSNAQDIELYDLQFHNALLHSECIDTNGDLIPDSNADKNQDGKLQKSELEAVTSLTLTNKNIRSLEGIEHFTQLKRLDASFNPLRRLNLKGNTQLEELNCFKCELWELNVTNNPKLTSLVIGKNALREIDVSNNRRLKQLNCEKNELDVLELGNNPHLSYLNFSYNRLRKIDLYHNVQLTKLVCQYNMLYELNVTNSPLIHHLNLKGNQVNALDLKKSFHINWLDSSDNPSLRCIRADENIGLSHFEKDYHHKLALECQ